MQNLPGANMASNILSKTGRDHRFTAESLGHFGMMTGPEVGPGTYNPRVTNDGEFDTIEGRVQVVVVRPTVNQKAQTIEQAIAKMQHAQARAPPLSPSLGGTSHLTVPW